MFLHQPCLHLLKSFPHFAYLAPQPGFLPHHKLANYHQCKCFLECECCLECSFISLAAAAGTLSFNTAIIAICRHSILLLLLPALPVLQRRQRPQPGRQPDAVGCRRNRRTHALAGSLAGCPRLRCHQHKRRPPHCSAGCPQAELCRRGCPPCECRHAHQRPVLRLVCRFNHGNKQQRAQRG